MTLLLAFLNHAVDRVEHCVEGVLNIGVQLIQLLQYALRAGALAGV